MSQHLDRIFYINLDKREDRKREIETELVQYGLLENTERIPAVLTPEQGILGCTMSHLHALKVAKERLAILD
jgi:GR25 family glycosyltransferase involved in LPS biosynthesis